MDSILLPEIKISFHGGDADDGLIDAASYGNSISSSAKLYSRALYTFENGKVPHKRSDYRLRILTGAPEKGCVFSFFYTAMQMGQMAFSYPQSWSQISEWFVSALIDGAKSYAMGKDVEVDKIMEFCEREMQKNRDFSKEMAQMSIGAVLQDAQHTKELFMQFAENERANLRGVVAPVGDSCTETKHRATDAVFFQADEPTAYVIKAKQDLELDNMAHYKCIMDGVDETNGACKVHIIETDQIIKGKIIDPALASDRNIYSHSMYEKVVLNIQARAALKNGQIDKLYISEAKYHDDTQRSTEKE